MKTEAEKMYKGAAYSNKWLKDLTEEKIALIMKMMEETVQAEKDRIETAVNKEIANKEEIMLVIEDARTCAYSLCKASIKNYKNCIKIIQNT